METDRYYKLANRQRTNGLSNVLTYLLDGINLPSSPITFFKQAAKPTQREDTSPLENGDIWLKTTDNTFWF